MSEYTYEDNLISSTLEGWGSMLEADDQKARIQTRRAVKWLRDDGGFCTRADFIDSLADQSTLSEHGWWSRAVRPGLQLFVDAGLISYSSGYHYYRWVGPDDEDRQKKTAFEC